MDPSPGTSIATYFADAGLVLFTLSLILLNSFFVAAEFAMVKLRATRVEIIAKQHGWCGAILRKVHNQLNVYLFAYQLDITLASLGLDWVGKPTFTELLELLLAMIGVRSDELIRGISFFTTFFIISYLHIVVGELTPRSWAIRGPELLSLWTAVPLYLFYWLMYPAIWLLSTDANAILKIASQGEPGPYHEHHYNHDELKLILHSSRTQDPSDQGIRVLASAMELGELEVIDWANSREDLVYLEHNAPLADILAVIRRHKHNRYPVWDSHKGEFIGLLCIKDLLLALSALNNPSETLDLDELMRPLEIVTKHTPLSRLLGQFHKNGTYFAVVEGAGRKVVGFLTMEDALKVLVGDIQDERRKTEYDILAYQPGKLLVRGDTPLFKLERPLGIDLDHIEADTFAGLIYDTLRRVPEEEEVFDTEDLRITVKKMRGPKIVPAKVVELD